MNFDVKMKEVKNIKNEKSKMHSVNAQFIEKKKKDLLLPDLLLTFKRQRLEDCSDTELIPDLNVWS